VARNRKRAKERRARRPQPVASRPQDRTTGAPSPLEHAAPDAEIAEQSELPPDLTEPELEELEEAAVPEDEELEESRSTRLGALAAEAEEDEAEFEEEEDAVDAIAGGGGRRRGRSGTGFGDGASSGGEAAAALPAPRAVPGNRLINFLQGSWRELQRVQWPDRQQVMQATGVVIGFVIVAGVFLGVADWAAGHLISFIENGHF
jgi:preprotein translocase SecE subunit